MPARASFSAAPGTATVTIAEFDGSSSSPARKRFASCTLWMPIPSIPMCSSNSSAGAAPTQENHAGEVSSRRASVASLSGGL